MQLNLKVYLLAIYNGASGGENGRPQSTTVLNATKIGTSRMKEQDSDYMFNAAE